MTNVTVSTESKADAAASAFLPIEEYLVDIKRMLRRCRDQGMQVPDAVARDISQALGTRGTSPDETRLEVMLRVHGSLSAIIAPATPRSLAATEFNWNDARSVRTYVLLTILIIGALVGLVGYVMTLDSHGAPVSVNSALGWVAQSTDVGNGRLMQSALNVVAPVATTSISKSALLMQLNYLFAAMLGAAFNGLLTGYNYLKNRSFDPDYVAVYLIRFVVGLLAGVVLANLGSEFFQGDETLRKLGPGIIALLGGYSAEAVRQILDRLVEVLITAVKGKDTTTEERLNVAKEVLPIAQAAASHSGTPEEVKTRIDALMRKLQQ